MTPRGTPIDVDANITDLIEGLWAHGITTFYCCEGDEHSGYLDDRDQKYAAAYISMKRDEFSMELIKAIFSDYSYFVKNWSTYFTVEIDKHFSQGDRICIRFPHSQINDLNRLVRGEF